MSQSFLVPVGAFLGPDFPLSLDRPFTTRQAVAAGIGRSTLARLVRAGLLRRPLRGVYVASQVKDSQRLRGQVLMLVVPPGSVVTDWSACWYWTGVDLPNSHIHVPPLSVFRPADGGRLRNSLVRSGERSFLPHDLVPINDRLSVTSPLRTAWDLGRFAPPVLGLGGLDALLRHGTFSSAQLIGEVERFRGQRGVVQLRQLAPLADARSESMGESGLRWRWHQVPGLPPPELQIPVIVDGIELFRLDLGIEEVRFAAEYDGAAFHGEDVRPKDERRRARLDEELGWLIEAFRREHVYGVLETATSRLMQGLIAARRRHSIFLL